MGRGWGELRGGGKWEGVSGEGASGRGEWGGEEESGRG